MDWVDELQPSYGYLCLCASVLSAPPPYAPQTEEEVNAMRDGCQQLKEMIIAGTIKEANMPPQTQVVCGPEDGIHSLPWNQMANLQTQNKV